MSNADVTILWFRGDLRLADNAALMAAVEREVPAASSRDGTQRRRGGGMVIPVFIWAPEEEGEWAPGGARRWWMHHSLARLDESLRAKGSRLIFRRGPTREALAGVIEETGATAVYWNRRYEPAVIARDKAIKDWLRNEVKIEAESFNSGLLHEPWTIQSGTGGPYKVFTPFWRNCQGQPLPALPSEAPAQIPGPARWPRSEALESFKLEPTRDWKDGLAEAWAPGPGEHAAHERLKRFLDHGVRTYKDDRNVPALDGTSGLSPHLCHGEIGPRQIFHAVRQFMNDGRRNLSKQERDACQTFITEIGWREFAYHVLYHFPATPTQPLQSKYKDFPWKYDKQKLKVWRKGRTGYPIIDAGMRQLWETGWMHNRVRMIVASFLVKDLLISWEEGEKWFWDTLVDADLANNTLGWQWAGGCGADAAPYFRIFNPVTQGQKHDAKGFYVRRYVPELKALPDKVLHQPWEAPPAVLREAGVSLGGDYPRPIVEHGEARTEALAALAKVKGG